MKIYVITEENEDSEKIIAIFFNKDLAECYLDDSPNINNWKIIELKGE